MTAALVKLDLFNVCKSELEEIAEDISIFEVIEKVGGNGEEYGSSLAFAEKASHA